MSRWWGDATSAQGFSGIMFKSDDTSLE